MIYADQILTGATVFPVASAPIPHGAVALRGDRILAVGTADAITNLSDAHTQIERLDPAWSVVPGFIDSHQHFLSYARNRSRVQLWETTRLDQVLERVHAAAAQQAPGTWIVAVGHDQGRLVEHRHPTLAELDAAVPDHPLLIYRACSHIALANSRALAAAGLGFDTPDPAGGRLERRNGALTGVLEELAIGLVSRVIAPPPIDWPTALRDAAQAYHRRGITSIGEAALGHLHGMQDLAIVERLVPEGGLGLRMYVMAYADLAEQLVQRREEQGGPTWYGDEWLRFGCIKYFADGTLGGGTAWLTEDYGDEPGNRGYPVMSAEELNSRVERAHRAGFQVAVHAIGDATVSMVLDAYERALRFDPRNNHRHRVEHVEALHAGLPERFKRLEVIAAIQSCFTYWEFGDVTRLGPGLAPWGHAWGALNHAGVVLANGSDNPVLPDFAPLQGLHAAVNRITHAGLLLNPAQALDLDAALHSYTLGAAYASFEESLKGSLEPGKLADLVLVAGDLRDTTRLAELPIARTIVGGKAM